MASEQNVISKFAPQMKTYYEMGPRWCPFLMFTHPVNFKSTPVNTDALGFRLNYFQGNQFSIAQGGFEHEQISVLVGGSTVFGDGATADSQTISAHLGEKNKHRFLNLGGRAYNSTQELILFNQVAYRYKNIKNIILLSGLNDLYLSRFPYYKDYFGGFFFSSIMDKAMRDYALSTYQKMMKAVLFPIFGDKIDYHRITRFNVFPRNKINEKNEDTQISARLFDVDAAVAQIKKNLHAWANHAKAYSCNLKYILQPMPSWAQKKLSPEEQALLTDEKYDFVQLSDVALYTEYSTKLKNICIELGIEFYDSNRLLGEYAEANHWLFIDRAHLTDAGNQSMAQIIQRLL